MARRRYAEHRSVTPKPYPHRRKWETRPLTAWSASWAKAGSDRCMLAAGVACRRRSAVRKRQDQAHTRYDTAQPPPRAPDAQVARAVPHARDNVPCIPDGAQIRAPQQQGLQLRAAVRVVCVQVRHPCTHGRAMHQGIMLSLCLASSARLAASMACQRCTTRAARAITTSWYASGHGLRELQGTECPAGRR